MSRIELIVEAIRERSRISTMSAHPHNLGCDGKGRIEVLKVDRINIDEPRLPHISGKITRCSSCGFVQKSGTLANDQGDYSQPGGSYYF